MRELRQNLSCRMIYRLALVLWFLGGTLGLSMAEENVLLRKEYKDAYVIADKEFKSNSENYEAAWKFAAAVFDWADFAMDDEDRERLALAGIAAAERAIALKPEGSQGYYYVAMNSGQLARTKTLGALRLVKEMERFFKKSLELDETFNYAGVHRSLGMLYKEAPGWPTSIGSKTKARFHLKKALTIAPDHPDNHLTYMEALAEWKEKGELKVLMQRYQKSLPEMKMRYKAEQYAGTWIEWDKRWKALQVAEEKLN